MSWRVGFRSCRKVRSSRTRDRARGEFPRGLADLGMTSCRSAGVHSGSRLSPVPAPRPDVVEASFCKPGYRPPCPGTLAPGTRLPAHHPRRVSGCRRDPRSLIAISAFVPAGRGGQRRPGSPDRQQRRAHLPVVRTGGNLPRETVPVAVAACSSTPKMASSKGFREHVGQTPHNLKNRHCRDPKNRTCSVLPPTP